MPRAIIVMLVAIFMFIGISVTVVTFQKCGAKALLLGNSAPSAAMLGMCD